LLPFELKYIREPTYAMTADEMPEAIKAPQVSKEPEQKKKTKKSTVKRGFEDSKAVKEDLESPVLASNAWAISGKYTASGKPLLVGDPHLPSKIPPFWLFMDVKVKGGVHLRGAFQTGTYSAGSGRNSKIAWVVTSLKTDAIDLYKEKRNPDNPSQYLYDGAWLDFEKVSEVIKVKGAPDVTLEIELSKHGPLLPKKKPLPPVTPSLHQKDIIDDIAICWTLHHIEDHSSAILIEIATATEVSASQASARKMRSPALSMIFGSDSGDIWSIGVGTIPIRDQFNSVPLDGSDSKNDWKGFVSGEELPFVMNPAKGFIVAANNNPCTADYKHFYSLGSEYSQGRAERITELLQALINSGRLLKAEDMHAVQQDELDVLCRDALPQMLVLTEHSVYWDEMSQWNCEHSRDKVEPHVYHMWVRLFAKALVVDELPEYADTLVAVMWYRYAVYRMMALYPTDRQTLQTDRWCDDVRTTEVETCSQVLSTTFKEAVQAVGDVPWGKVHAVQLKHSFSSVSALKPFFHRSVEVGGSDVTPHATTSTLSKTFETSFSPNARIIMDLGTDEYHWLVEAGQHGSVLNKHYDDMVEIFHYGPLVRDLFGRASPLGEQVKILRETFKATEL
jgi:penicillin amidase